MKKMLKIIMWTGAILLLLFASSLGVYSGKISFAQKKSAIEKSEKLIKEIEDRLEEIEKKYKK